MDKILANITGTALLTLGLSKLLPEGMWIYLLMVVIGTAILSWNVAREGVEFL